MTAEFASPRTGSGHGHALMLALVGFMGAGKTTVGRALAGRMGCRFQDLDEFVQKREGRTVEQIFQEQGEKAFRAMEIAALDTVIGASEGPSVLALGGGAFVQEEVRRMLREANIPVVFLDAPVAELFRRCEQPGVARPLRRDAEQFRRLYEDRRPAYLAAEIYLQTNEKSIAEIVDEIIAGLHLTPAPGAGT